MEAENGAERAQPGLRNGHSCVATVAISASNCGSFASSMGLNEKGSGLFRRFKADFSPWLESFCGGDFVNTIRHHPASGIGCIYSQKQACIRTQVLMHACFGGVCLPFLSPEFPLSCVRRKCAHTLFKKLSVRAEVCAVCCRGFPVGGFPVRQLTCR